MRIPVARDRDSTTNGGQIIAIKASIHDKGKKLALHGEHATCGNCKGSWPMYGTGDKTCDHGTPVVIHGDRVLCPCGKNRVIAGADARCFVHKEPGASKAATASNPSREPAPAARYDEQLTLLDEARRTLANVQYRIVVDGERVTTGDTDASRRTNRIKTDNASNLRLCATGEIWNE